MEQLLAHLLGDYVLQTDRMAQRKTGSLWWALVHGVIYTLPFLLLTHSLVALEVIAISHAIVDRFRLARYIVAFKNSVTDWGQRASLFHTPTGYPLETPPWMAFWLLIIVDNTLHLCINYAALRWL